MSDSPCIDLTKVIRVDQLGQGFPPVMADSFRLRGTAGKQLRQARQQIVTTALAKFGGQVRGPIRAIGFERIGKDRVGRCRAKSLDQRLADRVEVGGYGLVAERIENPAFGANRGPLDLLPGVARHENESGAWGRAWGKVLRLCGRQ